MTQSNVRQPLSRAPLVIRMPGPIVRRLLRFGMPMGPNGLLTVRGRISGEHRTQPLAVLELQGRRYVVGTFGDVNWCRNLRVSPNAELRLHGRSEGVEAVELSREQATEFFRDVVIRYVERMPLLGRGVTRALLFAVARDIISDPAHAAAHRPVFELRSRAS